MSSKSEREFDPRLLDLHLGRLSDDERAELEQRLKREPELAEQNEALATMFTALNATYKPAPKVPAGLTERISARVAAAGPAPRVVKSERRTIEQLAEMEGARVIRLSSFREIAAVAAMIVLAVGLGVPSMLHMRERGQRIACSANLANIGRGLQSYAMASQDCLPFAGWGRNATWRPTADPAYSVVPNRRHVYPLVRYAYVPAQAFVCPSARGLPMPEAEAANHDDFPESRNVSYAYQNMAGVRPSLRDNPDLPVLGDDNPFFDNGWPLFAAKRSLGLADPAETNSRAHGGAGQNILTIRGNVKWTDTPGAGIDGDNIWTLRGVDEYTGREGPSSSSDSHLLK